MNTFFSIASLSFTLFLLMDSIGNIPLFVSLLKGFNPKTQKKIIRRELVIALAIIIAFHFFGKLFMDLIDIRQETLLIAGGIILFLVAIHMVFPSPTFHQTDTTLSTQNPLIVPLATPLVAGPAVLAAVMLYSEQKTQFVALTSIVIAWVASVFVLTSAAYLKKFLGDRGVLACEKLMGLLLTLIAIQMCLKGITLYSLSLKEFLG